MTYVGDNPSLIFPESPVALGSVGDFCSTVAGISSTGLLLASACTATEAEGCDSLSDILVLRGVGGFVL
jgi:hypothetical protein